jgi:hypothetical protein
MISTSKGWIKEVKPESVRLGNRISVIAKNHAGWEVQKFKKGIGWTNACSESDNNDKPFIMETQGIAELLCEEIQKLDPEEQYRVYESLLPS